MATRWLISSSFLLAICSGCVAELDDGAPEELGEAELAQVIDNSWRLNGTQVNGTFLNGIHYNGIHYNGIHYNGVSLNGTLMSGVRADNSQPVSGTDFVGADATAVLGSGSQVSVRIENIAASGVPGLNFYTVKTLVNGEWQSICGNGAEAIPVKGVWDELSGAHNDGAEQFTFACRGAAIAKCVEWGYREWATTPECLTTGVCHNLSLTDFHQACIRMVRGDYCGDGVAHTENGTPIDVWDAVGIQTETPGTGMTLEAEWTVNGAACVKHTRWANADGSNPDKAYILAHCPSRWAGPENPLAFTLGCGGATSSFFTASGYSTPTSSRRLLRNASSVNLR